MASLLALASACGGSGETAIIGFGNGGNRITTDPIAKVADALAELEATPEVTDEMIVRVFSAILEKAEAGEPEAALILLRVAEEQREE
jgi:hypothetical protein